jgi:HK97 family phage major capsid protein
MRRRQLEMPVLDQTGTTAGRPHWFGGLQFYWMEEGGDKTASDAQFRSLALVARKLIGFTRAADELLDDAAISLDAFLSGPMGFAGGAAWMEDYAFLRGTGAGQPLGVINSPAAISVTRQTAGTVTYDDLANMLEAFLPSGNGVWLASQSLMSDLVTMTGPSGNPSYLWNGVAGQSIAGRVPGTLLGYPIIWDEKIPRRGYSGDIGLYDLSYYLIGDRQSTTVESTKFEAWKEDKTSWRMVHRVDGRPWLSAPFTYEDGETQVSPFVKLTGNTAS